jgi:hypothetical protein
MLRVFLALLAVTAAATGSAVAQPANNSTVTPTATPAPTPTATPNASTSTTTPGSGGPSVVVNVPGFGGGGGSSTETPTPTPTATPAPGGRQAVASLGPAVTLVSYEFHQDNQTFALTLRAEAYTQIVVSDALGPLQDEGVSTVPQRRVALERGETTVTMRVEEYRGSAAVSVASPRGAVYVSTGIQSPNPFADGDPTVGWVGGATLAVAMFVGAALYVLRKEGADPVEGTP